MITPYYDNPYIVKLIFIIHDEGCHVILDY